MSDELCPAGHEIVGAVCSRCYADVVYDRQQLAGVIKERDGWKERTIEATRLAGESVYEIADLRARLAASEAQVAWAKDLFQWDGECRAEMVATIRAERIAALNSKTNLVKEIERSQRERDTALARVKALEARVQNAEKGHMEACNKVLALRADVRVLREAAIPVADTEATMNGYFQVPPGKIHRLALALASTSQDSGKEGGEAK